MNPNRARALPFDDDMLATALKAPLAPRLSPTPTMRPSGMYSLQDRLPGVMGSTAPPTQFALRAMTATYPPPAKSTGRAVLVAAILAVVATLTAVAVYRDMHRVPAPEPPVEVMAP